MQIDLVLELIPQALVLVGLEVLAEQLYLLYAAGELLVQVLGRESGAKHLAVQVDELLAQQAVLLLVLGKLGLDESERHCLVVRTEALLELLLELLLDHVDAARRVLTAAAVVVVVVVVCRGVGIDTV